MKSICQYVKPDGTRCASPALHDANFCYYHYSVNRPRATVPHLENADAIQLALTDLARAVLAESIDLKRAAVLAYILQTASANLKRLQIGTFTHSMVTTLPDHAADLAAIDAAYSTLTPRANGDANAASHPDDDAAPPHDDAATRATTNLPPRPNGHANPRPPRQPDHGPRLPSQPPQPTSRRGPRRPEPAPTDDVMLTRYNLA